MGATAAWEPQSHCNTSLWNIRATESIKKEKKMGGGGKHVLLKGQNYVRATRSTAFSRTRPALSQKHQL